MDLRFGLRQAIKNPQCQFALRCRERAAFNHFDDVMQMSMGVLRLVFDGKLYGAETFLLNVLNRQAATRQPQ